MSVTTVTGTMNQNQDPPLHLAVRSGDVNKVRGVLSNSKMSINSIDDYGRTPLELACELGYLDIIKTLIDHTVQDDKGTIGDKLLKIALNYEKDEVILFVITELKCDTNIKGRYYHESPLHLACKKGNLSLIRTLICDYHADFNNRDSFGGTPFTWALENESDEVMLVLISEFGSDPTDIKDRNGVSPLHVACKKGNLSLVRTLIRDYHADFNDRDSLGGTPFAWALNYKRDEVMLVLISEFGCDPTNIKDRNGVSPLHVACEKGSLSLVRTLICDYHADFNDRDSLGGTPFAWALNYRRDEVMLVLISEFGCDPTNIKDRNGVSPLHVACKKGNLSLVRTLIRDYHADFNDRDSLGGTPFAWALNYRRDEVMLVLISEFGCDPTNIKGRNGASPLHVACEKGNLSLVRTLIRDYHADINDKDRFGNAPFILALENGKDEVINMLVLISEFGYNPTNIKGRNDVSPLHIACKKGNLSLVRTLIHDYHADINDKDISGKTPFTLALENERDEVMLVLISEFGCDPTNIKGVLGVSSLHVACKKGNVSLVRTLIRDYHADINHEDSYGKTPFALALNYRRDEVMLVLVSEFGSDPTNIKGGLGMSPLHVACKKGNLSLVRTLIRDYHADINDKDSYCETPFTLALENERDEVMLVLISEFGYDPTDIKGDDGVSPLHVACKKGNLSLVRTLIHDYHANLIDKDIIGDAPFMSALNHWRDEVMLLLISEFEYDPTNIKGALGVSPLHVACKKGNLCLVRTLICDYHTDLNDEDSSGKTPFTLALENERDEVMLVLTSEFGCDPTNIKGEDGVSPLHIACKKGNLSLVRTLIRDYHADLNDKDYFGKKPLTLALDNEMDEVMLVLISEFGYDPSEIKRSLLLIACKKGNFSLLKTLVYDYHMDLNDKDCLSFKMALENERDEIILGLFDYGYDPKAKDEHGRSLLHIACEKGRLCVARALILNQHLELHDQDSDGNTPLALAAEKGWDKVVLSLVREFDYDPATKGSNGRSLLHSAALGGGSTLFKVLIEDYHCDLNALDDSDNTPLTLAMNYESTMRGTLTLVSTEFYLSMLEELLVNGKLEYDTPLSAIKPEQFVSIMINQFSVDPNLKFFGDDTSLMAAVRYGRCTIVKLLISDHGCDISIKGSNGYSLLHIAIVEGHMEMFEMLVSEFGMSPIVIDGDGNTPLMLAMKKGMNELALALLEKHGCDPNTKDNEGNSPLHVVCMKGNLTLVKALMSHGADQNARNMRNDSPITLAAENGQDEVVLSLLWEFGCDPYTKCSGERSLLHITLHSERIELSKILIGHYNFDLNARDDSYETPLTLAVKHEALVRDQSMSTEFYLSILGELLSMGRLEHVTPLDFIRQGQLVSNMIEQFNIDTNLKHFQGGTLLHVACRGKMIDLVQILIQDFKAELDIRDDFDETPLMTAVKYGSCEIVKLLISDHGCDVNITGSNGWSLLHIAVSEGNIEVLKLLISQYNMSPLVVDEDGNTPLHLCAMLGQHKCVSSLLEEFQSPVYIRNKAGKTPIDVAKGTVVMPIFNHYISHNSRAIQADYQQLAEKKYCGAQYVARLFVVGHPGAGKSSLVEALKREGFFKAFSRVSEKSVPRHTAGIVPSIHTSSSWRIQFYDFAGDSEYYSSHAAILERIFQSEIGTDICIIVLDLREDNEEIRDKYIYWSTFINNSCRSLQNLPSKIVVGSHSDEVPNKKSKGNFIQSFVSEYDKESVYFSLDCCKPRSDRLKDLRKYIKSISKPYSLSHETSFLLGLLEKDFSSVVACAAHLLLSHIDQVQLCLPKSMIHLHPLLQQLQAIGELLIVGGKEDDSYLILSISQLTNEVHKELFSPEAADAHKELFSKKQDELLFNIGVLPESFLKRILPEYITKECLIQLQYCQEISPVEIGPDYSILPRSPDPSSSHLFFPALCIVDRSKIPWLIPPTSYSIGWLARCSRLQDYFPPRFLHVLLLRIALRFTVLAPSPQVHHIPAGIKRQCYMWKTGVRWVMEEDVECTVELLNTNKILVMTLRGHEEHASEKYNNIISCVMETKTEFCHSIQPDFFLLDSTDEDNYLNEDNLFSMSTVENFLLSPEGKEIIISDNRKKTMSIKKFIFMRRKLIYWYSLFPIEFFPVFQLLDEISAKWHDLGLYLGLHKNTLDVIQEENSSVQKRLKKMVSAWMNSFLHPPCWWHLAKALRDMKMGRLADEIERNHGQLVKCSLTPLT